MGTPIERPHKPRKTLSNDAGTGQNAFLIRIRTYVPKNTNKYDQGLCKSGTGATNDRYSDILVEANSKFQIHIWKQWLKNQ